MVKTYAPGFALIGALVALAFQINQIQSAISPLALCVAFDHSCHCGDLYDLWNSWTFQVI